MKPDQLKAWRLAHNLTQTQAAAALGIAYATYKFYESGKRSGHPVTIPRPIELATRAIGASVARRVRRGAKPGPKSVPVKPHKRSKPKPC